MIPEIGNIFLIISFVLAVSIFCLASYSYYLNREIINLSNLVYFKFVSILVSDPFWTNPPTRIDLFGEGLDANKSEGE